MVGSLYFYDRYRLHTMSKKVAYTKLILTRTLIIYITFPCILLFYIKIA